MKLLRTSDKDGKLKVEVLRKSRGWTTLCITTWKLQDKLFERFGNPEFLGRTKPFMFWLAE